MERRKFLKIMGAAGVMGALPLKFSLKKGVGLSQAWAVANSPALTKFNQMLPTLPALPQAPGQPLIQMPTRSDDPYFTGTDYYQVTIGQFNQVLHPDFVDPSKPAYIPGFAGTTLWGYRDTLANAVPQTHIGGLIIANRHTPVRIRFTNALPGTHILPVDISLPGAGTGQAENRAAVHLHGGLIPWISDGGPFDWWTPAGPNYAQGTSFLNGPAGYLDSLPGYNTMVQGQADYLYPNDQSYRLMWYHDHALGITRLNAYAGIATGYYIRDAEVAALETAGKIPPLGRLIPLVFQDKTFIPPTGNPDLLNGGRGGPGDLWYPSVYDGPPPTTVDLPLPSCVPEFFGDTMLVNGLVYPYVEVEQRKYRFMALNACNARFLRLRLVLEDPSVPGEPLNGYANPTVGPAFVQYATEGGFLPAPVTLTGNTPLNTLLLAPAERAEWIVDFSTVPANTKLLLYNDAAAPFPGGDDTTDYYPGSPNPVTTDPGFGPNTRTIMQIIVRPRKGAPDRPAALVLPALDPPSIVAQAAGQTSMDISLNEGADTFGRLIQMVGGTVLQGDGTFGIPYLASPSIPGAAQIVAAGDYQVWRIANLTGDTHPMHIHLVNWQIISRQPFDPAPYPTIIYTGPARGPDLNERGWKETVKMNPGEVITLIAKFDLPDMSVYQNASIPAGLTIPPSPRLATAGIPNANEYVWHCHILEHEEHDMMHALIVTNPVAASGSTLKAPGAATVKKTKSSGKKN